MSSAYSRALRCSCCFACCWPPPRELSVNWLRSSSLRLHANNVAQERTEAMDLALRQSAAKGQFFTTMSHELRTPLHGILGLTRLIQATNTVSLERGVVLN